MTPEEVRVALGLRPWLEFAQDVAGRDPNPHVTLEQQERERWRRTGRTTRMLVESVAAMSDHRNVMIVCHDRDAAVRNLQLVGGFLRGLDVPLRNTTHNRIQVAHPDWGDFRVTNARTNVQGFIYHWVGIDHWVDETFPEDAERFRSRLTLYPPPIPLPLSTAVLRRPAWEILLEESPWD